MKTLTVTYRMNGDKYTYNPAIENAMSQKPDGFRLGSVEDQQKELEKLMEHKAAQEDDGSTFSLVCWSIH